ARPRPKILRRPAAGGRDIYQDRLGVVFHFGVTEAAHDGQPVGAVDMGDTKRVPENFSLPGERATRKQERGESCEPAHCIQSMKMIAPEERHGHFPSFPWTKSCDLLFEIL